MNNKRIEEILAIFKEDALILYEKYNKLYQESLKPKEIVMDKEELFDYAKLHYPGGTYTVNSNPIQWERYDSFISQLECSGILYRDGIWAEIILKPEVKEETFSFVKGKYYSFKHEESTYWFQFDYLKNGEIYVTGYKYDNGSWQNNECDLATYIECEYFKEVTEQEAKGIEVKKEVDKWTVGGWVRLLKDYGHSLQHKKGTIAQITKAQNWISINLMYYVNDSSEECKLEKDTECEWIGMEKPLEAFKDLEYGVHVHIHHPKTGLCECGHNAMEEEWIPKVGDWIVIEKPKNASNWALQMDKLIGKCLKIQEVHKNYVTAFESDSWSWCYENNNKHFRKALPHEILNSYIEESGKFPSLGGTLFKVKFSVRDFPMTPKECIDIYKQIGYLIDFNTLLPKPKETPIFKSTRTSTNQLLKTKLN